MTPYSMMNAVTAIKHNQIPTHTSRFFFGCFAVIAANQLWELRASDKSAA
jgi:hypothetical protein